MLIKPKLAQLHKTIQMYYKELHSENQTASSA